MDKIFNDFSFYCALGAEIISSVNGIELLPDYIDFMKAHNGGAGTVGENAYLILFPMDQLEEINRNYCVEEFLPLNCIIGSSGGGELYGIDSKGNYFAVPDIPMEEDSKILLGTSFEEFISNLDTYLQ